MVLRAYEHERLSRRDSPVVTPIRPFWSGLSGLAAVFVVTAVQLGDVIGERSS
jgi:hypothetical protein